MINPFDYIFILVQFISSFITHLQYINVEPRECNRWKFQHQFNNETWELAIQPFTKDQACNEAMITRDVEAVIDQLIENEQRNDSLGFTFVATCKKIAYNSTMWVDVRFSLRILDYEGKPIQGIWSMPCGDFVNLKWVHENGTTSVEKMGVKVGTLAHALIH